jgi:hypothetical protein
MPVSSTAGPETLTRIRGPDPLVRSSTTSITSTPKAAISVPRTTE